MKLARIQVYRYRLPLRAPVALPDALLFERQGLLLRFTGEDGSEGWGEAAPLPGLNRESLADAEKALVQCAEVLAQHPFPGRIDELQDLGLLEPLGLPSVSFAVETAALALRAAMVATPLCHTLKADLPDEILINALLSGSESEILDKAAGLGARGFQAAKLKVGRGEPQDDVRRVHAVREALGPEMALRLDANQAWDLDVAVAFGREVKGCDIEYIEEPLWDPWQLRAFREETGIPYALDETLYQAMAAPEGEGGMASIYQLCEGVEAIVLKPTLIHLPGFAALLGGVGLPARRIVISAAYESGIGIAALAHYAAVFSGAETPVGLDTYSWLEEDVLAQRLPLDGGRADVNALDAAARTIDPSRLHLVWDSSIQGQTTN
jgi:O-succinylbenzoate synthase